MSTSSPDAPLSAILAEASRIEEDALYSARGHWEAAKPWERRHLWLGIPITMLAAAAGVSGFSDHPWLSGALAVVVSVGSAVITFVSPMEKHRKHAEAGNAYKALNNDARIFRAIECSLGQDLAALAVQLKELNERRNDLNASTPLIPRHAFETARLGIEAGEARHAVDSASEKV